MAPRFKREIKQKKSCKRFMLNVTKKLKKQNDKVQKTKQFILNLSNRPLTDNEVLLLSKGLKFIPSPYQKNTKKTLMKSFNEFARKLRCRYHFHEDIESKLHPFRVKSGFTPGYTCNALEQYIEFTKLELTSIQVRQIDDNLSPNERLAMKALKGNNDIVIKKADKSNTIVILDKECYIKEGERMLRSVHYNETQKPNVEEIKLKIENIINKMSKDGTIDKETTNYFKKNKQACSLGKFYLLPKIHKMDEQSIRTIKDGKLQ